MCACTACGAVVEVDAQRVATVCAYCTAPLVDTRRASSAVDAIVPFRLTKRAALERLRAYIGDRWWTPNPLRALARTNQLRTDGIRGVLVPFYAYDASIRADYSAQVGVHWHREETVKRKRSKPLSEGEIPPLEPETPQTRRVRETEWFDLRGHMGMQLDNHLQCASAGLSAASKLEPFDLGRSVPFEPKLMLGWDAELPSRARDEVDAQAHRTLSELAREHLQRRHLTGDASRLRTLELDVDVHRVRLLLLPVWLVSVQLAGKPVQIAINGQTGQCVGTVPTSKAKVALVVLVATASLLLLLWLRGALSWT